MHPTDRELLALEDGELPTARQLALARHLAGCPACARRLHEWRESEVSAAALMRAVDHRPPEVAADLVIARATRDVVTRWRPAIAAGFAVLILGAAAVAAALPGSTLRRYVQRVLAAPAATSRVPSTGVAAAVRPRQDGLSGIAFVPTSGVDIVFREMQTMGEIRITLGDASAVRVAHAGGHAAYSLDDAGVVVENARSSASYAIVLPRTGKRARILIGDHTVFAKKDDHIVTAAARDSSGSYVLVFTQLK